MTVRKGDRPAAPTPQPDPEDRLDRLMAQLGSRPGGLTSREAARRREQFGPNEISRREAVSPWRELAAQFTHPLALVLWAAGGLALASGNRTLAVAIVAVIAINAVLAFLQERQAERATEALREYLPPHIEVPATGTWPRWTPSRSCPATSSSSRRGTACPPMPGSSPARSRSAWPR